MKKILLVVSAIGLFAVPLIASYEEQETTPIPFSYFTGGGLFMLSSKCYIASRLERNDREWVTDYEDTECYWTCSEDVYRNICEPLRRKQQKWNCVTIQISEPGKLVIESWQIQKPADVFYPEYWSIAGAGIVEDVRSAAPALAPVGYYEGTRWCVTVDRATTLTMSVDYGLTDSHHSPCFDKFAFYPTSGRSCCLCPLQSFALNDGFVNVSGGSYRSGAAVRLEASVPFGQRVDEWRFFRGEIQFPVPEGAVQTDRSIEFVMPDDWCGIVEDESEMMVSVVLAENDTNQYGPYTPGEKVSISVPALVGYTAKGLPSGLKLNKKTGEISGTPKKATGDTGVIVTFTKKGAETLSAKFIVGPVPTINVTLEGDTEKCKLSGVNKAYLVGKKVSLSATAPKGTAFIGWFKDGVPWPNEELYLNAKLKYVMTAENLNLVAKFKKEKMSIDASALESAIMVTGTAVAEGTITVNVETQSGLKSLKAAKLPAGLKLKQNKQTGVWSVTGTPKKAGKSTVTLKATAKSGATESAIVSVVVE